MRPLTRRILLILAATGLSLTAGCEPATQGEVHVVVIGEEPELTDPSAGALSGPEQVLLSNVAQGLVRFDAQGQIVSGLAERWIVSDDGLSYIFRLGSEEWPDGSRVTAQQVARILRRAIAPRSRNPASDTLGAVEEIVAMTDRVIEFRLSAARPNLLQLLAQPAMGIVRQGSGTGPFELDGSRSEEGELRLTREVMDPDGEDSRQEEIWLSAAPAEQAIRSFIEGRADLVLDGTFVNLPLARGRRVPDDALQFDPVAGLFGLMPASKEGPLAEPEVRRLLSQAIDREALIASLGVPALLPRATILQSGIEGVPTLPPRAWIGTPIAERRPALLAESARLFGTEQVPELRIALPEGPGADLLFRRLEQDWGALGLTLIRVEQDAPADLRLIDEVAPSTSPAWFLRRFRCDVAPVCLEEADTLIDAARTASVSAQRAALFGQAALLMDEAYLFIPIAAPIRWSLVSNGVSGFAGNRFARHTLIGLREELERSAAE